MSKIGLHMIDDGNRPTRAKGHVMKRSGQNKAGKKRYYCSECKTYTPFIQPREAFKVEPGFENFALYALTGHFPRVSA